MRLPLLLIGWVIRMGVSTLEALDTEKTTMELYRFVFLSYLEVANRLIKLRWEAMYVDCIEKIIEEGWSFNDQDFEQKEDYSVVGGKILHSRYGIDYSQKNIQNAIAQFRAEVRLAELQEGFLWESLVASVQSADANCDCPEWGIAWWGMDEKKHRCLFLDDDLAIERISHYMTELRKLDRLPLPPYNQEVLFRFHGHGLSAVAPFSLR